MTIITKGHDMNHSLLKILLATCVPLSSLYAQSNIDNEISANLTNPKPVVVSAANSLMSSNFKQLNPSVDMMRQSFQAVLIAGGVIYCGLVVQKLFFDQAPFNHLIKSQMSRVAQFFGKDLIQKIQKSSFTPVLIENLHKTFLQLGTATLMTLPEKMNLPSKKVKVSFYDDLWDSIKGNEIITDFFNAISKEAIESAIRVNP